MSATQQLIEQLQNLKRVLGSKTEREVVDKAMDLLSVVAEIEEQSGIVSTCRGLPPPAEHTIQARMADEKFGPPRVPEEAEENGKFSGKSLLSGKDLAAAIWKRAWAKVDQGDARYMTALEDENAELWERIKRLEKEQGDG